MTPFQLRVVARLLLGVKSLRGLAVRGPAGAMHYLCTVNAGIRCVSIDTGGIVVYAESGDQGMFRPRFSRHELDTAEESLLRAPSVEVATGYSVQDMRGRTVLPGAEMVGWSFMGDTEHGGLVCHGTPEHCTAWTRWATAQGYETWCVPARGLAGGFPC